MLHSDVTELAAVHTMHEYSGLIRCPSCMFS